MKRFPRLPQLHNHIRHYPRPSIASHAHLRRDYSISKPDTDNIGEANQTLPDSAEVFTITNLEANPITKNLRLEDLVNGFDVVQRVEADSQSYFVVIKRTSYCLNFEHFFSGDYFVTPETLARYIRFRNMNIVELELRFIAQFIHDSKWGAIMFEKYSDALLILSNVFAELDFSNLDTFLETLFIIEKIGILANKEVNL
jgi:hypothetical protein